MSTQTISAVQQQYTDRIPDMHSVRIDVAQLSSMAFDDSLVTSKVRAAIGADPMTMALKVDIETKDGIVIIKGIVPNVDIAAHLVQLIAAIDGVREVRNKLRIAATG
jgi:hyperosmotically inducible protein